MAKLELTYHQAFPEDDDQAGTPAGCPTDDASTQRQCTAIQENHTERAASKTPTGASATATAPATSA